MGKHTQAFNEQLKGEPTFAEAENFTLHLSAELTEEIVNKITANTNKKWVSNIEIFKYCRDNNIETDFDPYDNYIEQPEFDFTKEKKEELDYSTLKVMDDVEIKGRKGIVMSHNEEEMTLIVEWYDTDEMETIDYSKER